MVPTSDHAEHIVKFMNENVNTNLEIVQAISLGRTLVRHGADGEMRFAQLRGKPKILPNRKAVLVPDEQSNASILEGFRYGGLQVRRSDGVPRLGDPSSKCKTGGGGKFRMQEVLK
jgi:hypothetical protein